MVLVLVVGVVLVVVRGVVAVGVVGAYAGSGAMTPVYVAGVVVGVASCVGTCASKGAEGIHQPKASFSA